MSIPAAHARGPAQGQLPHVRTGPRVLRPASISQMGSRSRLVTAPQFCEQNLALSSDPRQFSVPPAESIKADIASVAYVKGSFGSLLLRFRSLDRVSCVSLVMPETYQIPEIHSKKHNLIPKQLL